MPRQMIEQTTAAINSEIAKSSPRYDVIAHDALKIIYCCLSQLKLQEKEIEKAIDDMEFTIELGGGKILKSLTARSLSGKKPEPCDPPTALAS
jgi:hypothetical protein